MQKAFREINKRKLIVFLLVCCLMWSVKCAFTQETNREGLESGIKVDKIDKKQKTTNNGIQWLSISGNKIIDKNDNEVRLRGVQFDFGSICGDLGRYKMTADIVEFCDDMLDYTVTEEAFVDVKEMGANVLRFSLNTYKDFEYEPYKYKESNFLKLDKQIELAEKHNIYLLISMRQAPGGQNASPNSGNLGKNEFWGNEEYQNRIAALWKNIAERYSDKPIILGYDLLNEPEAPNRAVFNKVMNHISNAIREVDSKHIIVIEGNNWGKNLDRIDPPSDKNTAFSIHFYEPGIYAVKGKGDYPSVIKGQQFNKDALRKALAKRLKHSQGRVVIVGEFGAMSKAGNYLEYDRDVIDLFEGQNLSWIYWNYRNLRGKSDTQAIYYAKPDNEFSKFINDIQRGKPFSSFSDREKADALEALEISNFSVKQDLKDLLIIKGVIK